MPLTLREATISDIPALHRLYQQLQPDDTTTPEEMMAGFLDMQVHPGCQVLVAEKEGAVVSTFVLYVLPNLSRNSRPAAILENIVVDAAHRGQSIGRIMLAYARVLAKDAGCYKLSLTSNATRTEAHEFYRRCGMVQHGVSFRYSFDKEHA